MLRRSPKRPWAKYDYDSEGNCLVECESYKWRVDRLADGKLTSTGTAQKRCCLCAHMETCSEVCQTMESVRNPKKEAKVGPRRPIREEPRNYSKDLPKSNNPRGR